MKVIFLMLGIVVAMPALSEQASTTDVLQKSEKQSAFKGIFYKVWSKFKTISPKNDKQVRRTNVTAGIRGSETTASLLEPYWKGDRTSNEYFMQQLEAFAQAQGMADGGDLEGANKAFEAFLERWPESDLKPNAQFGQAMTLGALGQSEASKTLFNAFIQSYPAHPLVGDARELVSQM